MGLLLLLLLLLLPLLPIRSWALQGVCSSAGGVAWVGDKIWWRGSLSGVIKRLKLFTYMYIAGSRFQGVVETGCLAVVLQPSLLLKVSKDGAAVVVVGR